MTPTSVPIALRAFAVPVEAKSRRRRTRHELTTIEPFAWPPILVLDTETTTDATQELLFGSYGFYVWQPTGQLACLEEGLFSADCLTPRDPAAFAVLKQHRRTHPATWLPEDNRSFSSSHATPLRLLSYQQQWLHGRR